MTFSNSTRCFVAGASRGVGFEIAKGLRKLGHPVTALIHTDDARSPLEALGAQVAIGDVLEPEFIQTVFQNFQEAPFVLATTVGGKGLERNGPRADYLGNRHLIDAVKSLLCERFLLVSSIGVRDSAIALPETVLETLRPALLAKAKAEEHLIASQLPYTVVRPGGLVSEPATGKGLVTESAHVAGVITRIDVANLCIRCLKSANTQNKVLSAVDSDRIRSDALDSLPLESLN
ncbi:MAG: SDR family oxidoreductase [Leptolyngbyaceae cyanobacterium]